MPTKNRRSKRSTSTASDAIQLLTKDHDTVRGLLEQLEKTTSRGAAKREQLYQRVAREVRLHSRIEEEIFYPAYHEVAETQEEEKLYFEAAEEHALVDHVLEALDDGDPASDVYAAKCKVLKDLIEHHADEEEEELFPKAKKLLGKERLAKLGAQLAERKAQLESEPSRPAKQGDVRARTAEAARSGPAAARAESARS